MGAGDCGARVSCSETVMVQLFEVLRETRRAVSLGGFARNSSTYRSSAQRDPQFVRCLEEGTN